MSPTKIPFKDDPDLIYAQNWHIIVNLILRTGPLLNKVSGGTMGYDVSKYRMKCPWLSNIIFFRNQICNFNSDENP